MNQKIVVTGASGHIGYRVALQLLEAGYEIKLLVRKENQNILHLKSKGAHIFIADLQAPESYRLLLQDADVLFHIASENTTDTSDEKRVIENTYGLSKKVIDTAIAGSAKTIIYTSSVVVLGRSPDPEQLINEGHKAEYLESPYVKGKFLAEQYCEKIISERSIDIRRLYPSWVVGNNDPKLTPPHEIIKNYLQKGQAFYFNGGISIAAVEEVAKAHVNAWLKGKPNEKYILAGKNITFKEFYNTLSKHSGHKPPFLFIPKWIIYLGAITAKLILGKKSPVDPNYIKSVIGNYSWYNSEKAIKELGYHIPTIDSILTEAIIEAKKKQIGINTLVQKNNQLKKIEYEQDDILLITGFPGWLGNRMLDVLMNGDRFGNNAVNRKIRLLVQPKFKGLFSFPSNIEIVYGDIMDRNSLKEALKNVKAVYHLAGIIYPKKIKLLYEINFVGTKNLVDICIDSGVRRLLYMGTDSICGYGRRKRIFDEHTPARPYKNYGKSKYLGEKYILDKTAEGKITGTSLRGFWFFGPFMPERNMSFFNMFYWKRQLVFGNGKNYRSISHVDNIIQAFIKAEKRKETIGKWYWIGNKKPDTTVDQIYTHVANALGVTYKPLYVSGWICELFSILDIVIGFTGKLNATIHAAGKFHKDIAGEITEAQKDFDYDPDVEFEEIKKELPELIKK
ncbi:MAG: NAD-dependent epimerase/dehydratase family protein [Bacteroidota bacterium]